jgi:hypothetical protein
MLIWRRLQPSTIVAALAVLAPPRTPHEPRASEAIELEKTAPSPRVQRSAP